MGGHSGIHLRKQIEGWRGGSVVRALVALTEDGGLNPSTHMAVLQPFLAPVSNALS